MTGGWRYPKAEAIARALWAAAGVFDERAVIACSPRRVMMGGVNPTLTASWYVLDALAGAYPHVPIATLARWCGIRLGAAVPIMPQLMRRRRAADWRPALVDLLTPMVGP